MTLDEAIQHADEKGQGTCQCHEDHRQLADWLRELKTFRETTMTEPKFQILPYPTEDAPGVPLADRRQVHQCHVCREHPAEPLIASKYPNQGINFVCRSCLEAAVNALYEYKGDKPRYSYDPDSGEVKLDPQGLPQRDPAHEQQAQCARRGCGHPYDRHFDPYWGDLEVGCKYCGHCTCSAFVEPKP